MKAVDPSNLVISAGLGPIAVPPWTIGPMRFARLMLCMTGGAHPHPTHGSCEGGVHFDIFAIHPYTTGAPTHEGGPDDVELGDLPKLQNLLAAADRAGRIKNGSRRTPLWITEFSWDSKPPDPGGLPMKIETRWTAEALYRAWRAKVSHFFWYSLDDSPPEPNRPYSETLQSGLYFRGETLAQDQPKEIMYAFRFPFVSYSRRQGLYFWGRTPSSEGGKVTIQLWRSGHWRNTQMTRANKSGIFRGIIHNRYGSDKRGLARALYRGHTSPPFSMHPVKDFYHPPSAESCPAPPSDRVRAARLLSCSTSPSSTSSRALASARLQPRPDETMGEERRDFPPLRTLVSGRLRATLEQTVG